MSELPIFTQDPFRRSESPETSPLSTPLLPSTGYAAGSPRRMSILRQGESDEYEGSSPPPRYVTNFAKRHSNVGLPTYNDRKPSVAPFHGDLIEKQTRKNRQKAWLRALISVTCLLAALLTGIAIGYWALPFNKSATTATSGAVTSPSQTNTPEHVTANSGSTGQTTPYWKPKSGTTFQIQLNSIMSASSKFSDGVDAYDIDLFDTPASTITALKTAGKKVICYFSAGTAENWRSDYSQFTAADLGSALDGWAGENWLYTPSSNVRKIMLTRLQLAKSKGCDGVDPDNIDVYNYAGKSGFSDLSQATAIDYVTYLANQAHTLGLAMGLKNSGEIIPSVLPLVEYVISESCVQYKECAIYQPFIAAGKPAFNIQYPFGSNSKLTTMSSTVQSKFCTQGGASFKGFTNVLKHQNLDTWFYQC